MRRRNIKWTLTSSSLVPPDTCYVLAPDPEKPYERTLMYAPQLRHRLLMNYHQLCATCTDPVFIPVDLTADQLLMAYGETLLRQADGGA